MRVGLERTHAGTPALRTRPHYADGWVAHSIQDYVSQAVFRDRILPAQRRRTAVFGPGLLPQLEIARRRHIRCIACLLKVSFNVQGLLKKFLSNNKFGGENIYPRTATRMMNET